jgi:outer membrane lipoprotein carrier protein
MLATLLLVLLTTTPDATDLVSRVQAHYDALRDLRAEFVQRQLNRALGAALEERGMVYMKRPRQMRWEYREPERKLLVSDGRQAWWYLPEDHQVQVMDHDLDRAPTLLLGDRRLLEQYAASWARFERPRKSGNRMVRLEAKQDGTDYPSCLLEIDPASATIERLVLEDAVGNRAEYRLERVLENPGLDPKLFHFVPPPGVEVVPLP